MQPPNLFISLSDLKNPGKSSLHRDEISYDRPEDVTNKSTDPNQYLHELDDDSYEVIEDRYKETEEELLSTQKTVQAQQNLITVTSAQLLSKEKEFAIAQEDWRRQLIQAHADVAAKEVQINELERQLADAYTQLVMATGKSMMQILHGSENVSNSPPERKLKRSRTESLSPHLFNKNQKSSSPSDIRSPNFSGSPHPVKQSSYIKWTPEEDELLKAAVALHGTHKWSVIATHVPNRTPMQCSARWLGALNTTIHKGRWTQEEDKLLSAAVSEYIQEGTGGDQATATVPWNKIASNIPNRTGIQCQARWSEALDPTVRKGRWTLEEDEHLKDGVRKYGRCWIRIAQGISGRTQRQCRTRWVQVKEKAGLDDIEDFEEEV
ncbi:hypothetical protein K7432_006786 [Basidiobolus ranarum]|uniref:Uncharacterized protein n=1 Tax=Basidiobolus ranarum TaxID=34480 RepID=A0ABR2W125_9FUNG